MRKLLGEIISTVILRIPDVDGSCTRETIAVELDAADEALAAESL